MVDSWKKRIRFLGSFILLAMLAAACSNGPEETDAGTPDIAPPQDVDVGGEINEDVPVVTGAISLSLGELGEEDCACDDYDGWCTYTRDELSIKVFATVKPDEVGGLEAIEEVSLALLDEDGKVVKTLDTDIHPQPAVSDDDPYDFFELDFSTDDVDGIDGNYDLRIQVKSNFVPSNSVTGVPLSKFQTIQIRVDSTPPDMNGDFVTAPIHVENLCLDYCIRDWADPNQKQLGQGSGVSEENITITLDGEPLPMPEKVNPVCPTDPICFDVAQAQTKDSLVSLVATDCLGNELKVETTTRILGLPSYELPSGLAVPPELGGIRKLRTANLVTQEEHLSGVLYPDLAAIGNMGIAFAYNDEEGDFTAPEMVLENIAFIDARTLDLNGDGATDIVGLYYDPDQGSSLTIYLQDTKLQGEWDEDGEVFEIGIYEPLGTFPEEPSQVITVPGAEFHIFEMSDVDRDGILDVVLAGANDELCMALILGTGAQVPQDQIVMPVPEEGEEAPEVDTSKPPELPELADLFVLQDTLQGIGGIADIRIGRFRSELGQEPLDIYTHRPAEGVLTTVLLDDGANGLEFSIPLDTIHCRPGNPPLARRPDLEEQSTDIYDDLGGPGTDPHPGVEDLLYYSSNSKSLHLVVPKGDGYYDVQGKVYQGSLLEGGSKKYMNSVCISAGVDEDDAGFGQHKTSGVLAGNLLEYDLRPFGIATVVGDQPDTILLVDLVGRPELPDNKDGVLDIVVSIPTQNQIAIFRGMSFGGVHDGMYSEALFVNPGPNPRSVVAGDFDANESTPPDLACVVGSGTDERIVVLRNNPAKLGVFNAPLELPMPPAVDYTTGRVEPTHFAVADLGADGDYDFVVATVPVPQDYLRSPEDSDVTTVTIPTILTFEMAAGRPISEIPLKSGVDVNFSQELSGMTVGYFTDDDNPDVAVAIKTTNGTWCDGRSFDVLVGNQYIKGLHDPAALGTEGGPKQYYEHSLRANTFRPEGGFFGLQNTTGIMTARLNLGDDRDDIILFGEEHSEASEPDYQSSQVAAYITRYDSNWNTCPGATKEVYFDYAPLFPLQLLYVDPTCDPWQKDEREGEEDPPEENPIVCVPNHPDITEYDLVETMGNKLQPGQARPSDWLAQWEAGFGPIAGMVAHVDSPGGDTECLDVVVANAGSNDFTYLRGTCDLETYQYIHPGDLHSVGTDPVSIKVSDLDQDGMVDVVAALQNNVSIVYGYKGHNFEAPQYMPKKSDTEESLSATGIDLEDVNYDGWDDVLVTSAGRDSILVYLNAGERQYFGPYELPTGVDPIDIIVAPLDDDECNDIAVLNRGSRSITMLRNKRCD